MSFVLICSRAIPTHESADLHKMRNVQPSAGIPTLSDHVREEQDLWVVRVLNHMQAYGNIFGDC